MPPKWNRKGLQNACKMATKCMWKSHHPKMFAKRLTTCMRKCPQNFSENTGKMQANMPPKYMRKCLYKVYKNELKKAQG
jgi:hypothetical protein